MRIFKKKTCPVWVGYLLILPVRKLYQNPYKILSNYLSPGMQVIDYGCGMGFFSLPMAKMVSPNGKVICIDIQEKMIEKLKHRLRRKRVNHIIETRVASAENKWGLDGLKNKIDFILLFAVLHEVYNKKALFTELYKILKKTGKILFVEPKHHVPYQEFKETLNIAESVGFICKESPKIKMSYSIVLSK